MWIPPHTILPGGQLKWKMAYASSYAMRCADAYGRFVRRQRIGRNPFVSVPAILTQSQTQGALRCGRLSRRVKHAVILTLISSRQQRMHDKTPPFKLSLSKVPPHPGTYNQTQGQVSAEDGGSTGRLAHRRCRYSPSGRQENPSKGWKSNGTS